MKHIYYKNDFAVEITLLNASGKPTAPPVWQWHIEFTDGRRKYICSVDKGNAKVVGNTIMCYLDNHKFCCGEVGYKFVQAIPDLNYLDGFQNLITPKALPIELWEQESDDDVNIQSSVVPAYVVYDAYMTAKANGYAGTAEEFYDALNHIVDINKKEAERVEAEANRVTAEQQRVENFVAMESALTTATSKANTATTKAEEASKRADNSATAASQARVQATLAANGANAAAAQATQAMEKTNKATENAKTATANANNSAVNAGNAATEANEATKSANDATEKAKTATIAAEQSAERANTAADNADVATSNATTATNQAMTATKRANDISADLEAKREADYWRGAKGDKGDDGVSPTVSTSKTGKVTTIEITDAQGTHTATVNDGESVDIVQSTGTSTTAVMSQKASTESFIANTPSGDPLHYLYELVGGVYNGTGKDIVVSDPIVGNLTHKAGCWWCTGLGDLTNDDMRKVYAFGCNIMNNVYSNVKRCYNHSLWRTTCTDSQYRYMEGYFVPSGFDISYMFCFSKKIEIIKFTNILIPLKNMDYAFYECSHLTHIYSVLDMTYCKSITLPFRSCKKLTSMKIKNLKSNIEFKDCEFLSIESIIYMIENATDATFTITLHPEAYERAIADAGVQAALANKTNVSLAKGE